MKKEKTSIQIHEKNLPTIQEIWKDVVGYEGKYRISSLGRAFSIKNNMLLKRSIESNGYEIVSLWNDGIRKKGYIHRMVAMAFIHNSENKRTVNHKNGVKTDNRLCNLEWATDSENNQHAWDNGLKKVSEKQVISGKNVGVKNGKIVIDTYTGIYYNSVKEASLIIGINHTTLSRKLCGSIKNNTSLKYI